MSGSTPLIDQITFASSQKEVIVNRVNNSQAPAAVYGIKTLVGLSLVVYGGTIDVAGTPTVLANQTVTLTNAATNYVKASSAGVVSVVTSAPSGWPGPLASGVTALYTIVTSGGVYTSITEWRIGISPPVAAVTFTGGTLTSALNYAPTVTIASSATPAIGAAAGNYISITGTTTITGFDTIAAGAERIITFTGILTFTHNGTSLILPTAANITTAAGDTCRVVSLGSGNWKCLSYQRADGTALTGPATPVKVIQVACSDETTAITTGTAKVTFRMPYAMTLTAVRASLSTVSSSGNPAIDINESGASIFSTTLTIDASEKTSTTAATPAVISDSSLADDAEMTVDIDTAGTGAKGLKITLIGT